MAPYHPVVTTNVARPGHGAPTPPTDYPAPTGTFAPGTKIQVGSQKVVIQKYFSEGGFAHVYLVKMPKPIDGTDIAILKRVAVPDKEHLASMRTEVETMKKLKGHRPIVTYYDSHASQLKGGGYEVFLLMEFCNGGGLIDFMNTRLQTRLTEPEILNIFSDVAEGVACMHYLKPPLLHRDLKVENVLITNKNGIRRFKLCDFGSTAPPRQAASTVAECRLIEEDVQRHTTLQYRSPEMVDVYRKLSISEKSDIWALGVLLYKLCYYTTPFEAQGQLAILNASFTFPEYPPFSDNLKKLIASMLKENPRSRPNIYQVLREACLMQGIDIPIKDIYEGRDSSDLCGNTKELPSNDHPTLPVGAVFAPPPIQQKIIPDVVPMRRGRPTVSQAQKRNASTPVSAAKNDPWASLDSKTHLVDDDVSKRFPSLDQFSLLHDGGKLNFDGKLPGVSQDITKRVTEKLADDAFAIQTKKPISKAQEIISNNPELQAASNSNIYQPLPLKTQFRTPSSSYVSQGTMTSPSLLSDLNQSHSPKPNSFDFHRNLHVPRNQDSEITPNQPSVELPPKNTTQAPHSLLTYSSSLENIHLPSKNSISHTKSKKSPIRPAGTYLESNIDFLREKELTNRATSLVSPKIRPQTINSSSSSDTDEQSESTAIEPNLSLLRQPETEEKDWNHRRFSSEIKSKRSSLPSFQGPKGLLVGRFGDAFKRFENITSPQVLAKDSRTPSPKDELEREDTYDRQTERFETKLDKPINHHAVNDESIFDISTEALPPEERRELERRRLSVEEKRVLDATVEYRKMIDDRESLGVATSRSAIRMNNTQNKARSILDENQNKSKPLQKTMAKYSRYTGPDSINPPPGNGNPYAAADALVNPSTTTANSVKSRQVPKDIHQNITYYNTGTGQATSSISTQLTTCKTGGARPTAPPKPFRLNHVTPGTQATVKATSHQPSISRNDSYSGVRTIVDMRVETSNNHTGNEEFLVDFSKRFPSLSGVEMVEREINARPKERSGKKLDASRSRPDASSYTERAGVRSKEV